MLHYDFSNITQLFYLTNGQLTLGEATAFASQFRLLTHASDSRELAQALITNTIDLQYHLIVDNLFSLVRGWYLNKRIAKRAWKKRA
jgi:hypothetical protein